MTLLSIIQDSSVEIGIARPTQIIADTSRTSQDAQAVIKRCVDMILESHDWQALKAINTYTGDDVTEAFDLPADYHRMLKDASVWTSRYKWAVNHVVDSDTWLELLTLPYTQVTGSWTIYGGQFHLMATMATAETAKFFYIQNTPVLSATSDRQTAFLADTDTFMLDEELLRRAFVYVYKQEKGRDYGQEYADYQDKLYKCIDRDGGSKPIVTGMLARRWSDRNVAWPGTVTVTP